MRSRLTFHSGWRLLGLILCFALLDQGSKLLALRFLDPARPWPLIPHVFQLNLAFNTGAAFSLFSRQPHLLLSVTLLIFLGLLFYAFSRRHYQRGELICLGLILGGSLGNLLDRLRFGRVTDFLDFMIIRYPIFNLADTFIFCGVIGLVWILLTAGPGEATGKDSHGTPPAGQ